MHRPGPASAATAGSPAASAPPAPSHASTAPLMAQARASLEQTSHGLRDVHRERIALTEEYARRGQMLIRSLAILDHRS